MKYVIKYTICMVSLMTIECLKVVLIIYGSSNKDYYSYEKLDGFNNSRYVYNHELLIQFIGLSNNGASIFHMLGYQYAM